MGIQTHESTNPAFRGVFWAKVCPEDGSSESRAVAYFQGQKDGLTLPAAIPTCLEMSGRG